MALAFGKINGSAKKNGEYYKLKDGENVFRMVGGILPRYQYWVRENGKNIPFECLSFDRGLERFTNVEKDWIGDHGFLNSEGKPLRCSWAYAVQIIDPADGKLKVLSLKKKMFETLLKFCQDAEIDPTSTTEGIDIVVDRVKTGSQAFNVDYNLNQVKMLTAGKRPLTEEELEAIAEIKDIEEVLPRPTSEQQEIALDKLLNGSTSDESDNDAGGADKEAINELD